jgi:hypothetical protein
MLDFNEGTNGKNVDVRNAIPQSSRGIQSGGTLNNEDIKGELTITDFSKKLP